MLVFGGVVAAHAWVQVLRGLLVGGRTAREILGNFLVGAGVVMLGLHFLSRNPDAAWSTAMAIAGAVLFVAGGMLEYPRLQSGKRPR